MDVQGAASSLPLAITGNDHCPESAGSWQLPVHCPRQPAHSINAPGSTQGQLILPIMHSHAPIIGICTSGKSVPIPRAA